MSSTQSHEMKNKKEEFTYSIMDDDIIEEILIRLPVKALARCRCLSKKWNRTISCDDPSFRSRLYRLHAATASSGPCQFLGFFINRVRLFKFCTPPLGFLPVSPQGIQLSNTLGLDFDVFLSFMGRPPNELIHIMASSNGFLLCSLQEIHPRDYFLCNPITKQWIALPPTNSTSYTVSHGLFCDPATCYSSFNLVKFKVVRGVWVEESTYEFSDTLRIETFSSHDHDCRNNEWKVLHLTCPFQFLPLIMQNIPAMVSDQGGEPVFYWPAKAIYRVMPSVVVFDPRNEYHLDLIRMPETDGYSYADYNNYHDGFGQSEGGIVYVRTDRSHLEIWGLDRHAKEWRQKHKVEIGSSLQQLVEVVGWRTLDYNFRTIGVHPNNSQLIFMTAGDKKLVTYDARNSKFSLVWDAGNRYYYYFVYNWPHWPSPVLI